MTASNKKLYTRHTKATCLKAIKEAIKLFDDIRIEEINEEGSKLFLCRKGTFSWNNNDTVINITTNTLNGLTEIEIVIKYQLQKTMTGTDVAFSMLDGSADSAIVQKEYNNRTRIERAENILYNIKDAISSQLGKYPVEYTFASNIWHYGDSLYQKLRTCIQ
jgi:hypothetical protein